MSFTSDIAGSGTADFAGEASTGASLAGAAAKVLFGFLANPSNANSSTESVQVGLINLHDLLRDLAGGMLYVMGQVYGAWQWAQSRAKQIGKDFETIEQANIDAVSHVKDTILPHSLGYLQGYIFSTGITPLRHAVDKLDHRVSFLEGWRGQINTWRHDYVDPQIEDWRQFHSWFNANAAPAINTLRGWIDKPSTFADFAVPAVARPLLTYLAADTHKTLRDDYSAAMVQAWADRPNTTWDAVLRWLVTDG